MRCCCSRQALDHMRVPSGNPFPVEKPKSVFMEAVASASRAPTTPRQVEQELTVLRKLIVVFGLFQGVIPCKRSRSSHSDNPASPSRRTLARHAFGPGVLDGRRDFVPKVLVEGNYFFGFVVGLDGRAKVIA